jgi:hypothetical protein
MLNSGGRRCSNGECLGNFSLRHNALSGAIDDDESPGG